MDRALEYGIDQNGINSTAALFYLTRLLPAEVTGLAATGSKYELSVNSILPVSEDPDGDALERKLDGKKLPTLDDFVKFLHNMLLFEGTAITDRELHVQSTRWQRQLLDKLLLKILNQLPPDFRVDFQAEPAPTLSSENSLEPTKLEDFLAQLPQRIVRYCEKDVDAAHQEEKKTENETKKKVRRC